MSTVILIKVKVVGDDDRTVLTRLNIIDSLSTIREILEYNSIIRMDDTLLFSDGFTNIMQKDELDFKLEEIIENNDTLFLKPSPSSNLDYFRHKLKLEFGRILSPGRIIVESSEKRVFTMNIEEKSASYSMINKDIFFNSKKGWIKYIKMFFNAEAEMMNFGSLGLRFSSEQNTNNQTENKILFTKVSKLSLRINKLRPTQEFIEEVKHALNSNDRGRFDKIYKYFGQFIPTEVTLGGILYYYRIEKTRTLGEKSQNKSIHTERSAMYLIGGKPQNLDVFDEDMWIKSLEDYETWECIEFRSPINIFQLLDGNLYKEVCAFLGKKILYSEILSHSCQLEYKRRVIINLPLRGKICEVIKNEEANCSIFATVVDEEERKNDFLNCQIYHPRDKVPQLIIHCFQKKQKHLPLRKLKIAFMIVGYDIYFNNFNYLNDEMQLRVLSIETNNHKLNQPILRFESNEISSFLGIPVLKELNNTNESIVIGNYFLNIRDIFTYSLFQEIRQLMAQFLLQKRLFCRCHREIKLNALISFRIIVMMHNSQFIKIYSEFIFIGNSYIKLGKSQESSWHAL
ncbi:unnamed protein product [Rhizophagus irregularis]|nr:unnamed protein product [Rhizophagus irregularis]